MSPMSSPFVPCIRVPRSQIASVTAEPGQLKPPGVGKIGELTCRHGHASRDSALILDVHHLVIYHIVSALVHTSSVLARLERLGNILDVKNIRVDDVLSPLQQVSTTGGTFTAWNSDAYPLLIISLA